MNRRTAAVAIVLLGALSSVTFAETQQSSHKEVIDSYVLAMATSVFAQKNCSGLTANVVALVALRSQANIQDTEEPYVEAEITKRNGMFKSAFLQTGQKKWCGSIESLFGPNGTMAPGFILKD